LTFIIIGCMLNTALNKYREVEMANFVQRVLRKERIAEICKEYNLSEGDEKIINEILDEWDNLFGETDKKIEMAFEKTFHLKHRQKIFNALLKINHEFVNGGELQKNKRVH